MPKVENLYEKFKVNSDATDAQLGKVYAKLATKYNPDTSKDKKAADKLLRVNEIYEILTDPKKRAKHDEIHGFSANNVYNYAAAKAAKSTKTADFNTADFSTVDAIPKTRVTKTVTIPKTASKVTAYDPLNDPNLPEEMERVLIEAELLVLNEELALVEEENKAALQAKIKAANAKIAAIKKLQKEAKAKGKEAATKKATGTTKAKEPTATKKAPAKKSAETKAPAKKATTKKESTESDVAKNTKAEKPATTKKATNQTASQKPKKAASGSKAKKAKPARKSITGVISVVTAGKALSSQYSSKKPAIKSTITNATKDSPITIVSPPTNLGDTIAPSSNTIAKDLKLDNIPITIDAFPPTQEVYPATINYAENEVAASENSGTTIEFRQDNSIARQNEKDIKTFNEESLLPAERNDNALVAKEKKKRTKLKALLAVVAIFAIAFLLYGVLATVAVTTQNRDFMGGMFGFMFAPIDDNGDEEDPITHTITFTAQGNGNIRGQATQVVEYGEYSTYVFADPHTGYRFTNWLDGYTRPYRRVNASQDATFTAIFAPLPIVVENPVNITVTIVGGGTVWGAGGTGTLVVEFGSTVYLFAEANANYIFSGFSVTGYITTSVTEVVLSLPNIRGDITVTATFTYNPIIPPQYFDVQIYLGIGFSGGYLEVNGVVATPDSSGIISLPIREGSPLLVRAIAHSGYIFNHWEETAQLSGQFFVLFNVLNTDPVRHFAAVTQQLNLIPVFTRIMVEFSVSAVGNGTVQDSGTNEVDKFEFWINDTAVRLIQAVPNSSSYRFVGWNDGFINLENRYIRNATDIRSDIQAIFERIPYIASFVVEYGTYLDNGTQMVGGTISNNNPQNLLPNTTGSFVVAESNAGFRFSHWSKNNTHYSYSTAIAPSNLTADTAFTAVFVRIFSVSFGVYQNIGGILIGQTTQIIDSGNAILSAVTAVPNSLYNFVGWFVEDNEEFDDTYLTLTPVLVGNINSDTHFVAHFNRIQINISFSVTSYNGELAGQVVEGSEPFVNTPNVGTNQSINLGLRNIGEIQPPIRARAELGFRFVHWAVSFGDVISYRTLSHASVTLGTFYTSVGSNSYILTLQASDLMNPVTVAATAVFEPIRHEVNFYINNDGGVIVGSVQQFVRQGHNSGLVTAVAREGYEFLGWRQIGGDGSIISEDYDFYRQILAAVNFRAYFSRIIYELEFSVNYTDRGFLIVGDNWEEQLRDAADPTDYQLEYFIDEIAHGNDGTTITAVSLFPELYYFSHWSDGYTNATRYNLNIRSSGKITAIFNPYIIIRIETNSGGRLSGTIDEFIVRRLRLGDLVLSTPIGVEAMAGHTFSHWLINGEQRQGTIADSSSLYALLQYLSSSSENFITAYRNLTFRAVFIGGSEATVFVVNCFETLLAINVFYAGRFRLVADLDLNEYSFVPLAPNGFRGEFNNPYNRNIYNVNISAIDIDGTYYAGFFASITSGGVVNNLRLENININTTNIPYTAPLFIGGLAGRVVGNNSVVLMGVRVSFSSIRINNSNLIYIGGLIGRVNNNLITIMGTTQVSIASGGTLKIHGLLYNSNHLLVLAQVQINYARIIGLLQSNLLTLPDTGTGVLRVYMFYDDDYILIYDNLSFVDAPSYH